MAVFIGTFENKVDKKGRVSVPAAFRASLGGSSFQGIISFRSYRAEALEACGMDFMERLGAQMDEFALFSDTHNDLATAIFADSHQLSFDSEGRILLPQALRDHAHITDRAAFVGKGQLFQIWEPERLEAEKEAARQRARENGLTLPMGGARPAGGQAPGQGQPS